MDDDLGSEEVVFMGNLPIVIEDEEIHYFGEKFKIQKGDGVLISGGVGDHKSALGLHILNDVINNEFGRYNTIYLQREKLGNKFNNELFLNTKKQIERNNSKGSESVIIIDTNFDIFETVKNYTQLKATKIFILPLLGISNDPNKDTMNLIKRSCNKMIILEKRNDITNKLKMIEVHYDKRNRPGLRMHYIDERIGNIRKNNIKEDMIKTYEKILINYKRLTRIPGSERAVLFYSEAIMSTISDIEKIMKPVIDSEIIDLHNNIKNLIRKISDTKTDATPLEEGLIKSEIGKINELTIKEIKNQTNKFIDIKKFDDKIRINSHLMPIYRKLKILLKTIRDAIDSIEDKKSKEKGQDYPNTKKLSRFHAKPSSTKWDLDKDLGMKIGNLSKMPKIIEKEEVNGIDRNQINTSLALIIRDENQNNERSNMKNRDVALLISNKFNNGKGINAQGINATIKSKDKIQRRELVASIFNQTDPELNLRQLQRSGEIGHVEITISSNNEGRISISSSLDNEMNLKITKSIERIKKIGSTEVEILTDKRIGVKKKIIIVDNSEKYLQYLWDVRNEINSLVLFNQKLEAWRKKNILQGTDVLIVDCEENLEKGELLEILHECRPNGTAKEGHFLFIEVDNGDGNDIKRHAFNNWINKLRNRSGVNERSLSAGLKKIIRYNFNSDGTKVNQESKKAIWLEEIHHSEGEIIGTYLEIKNSLLTGGSKNEYQFKCLNEEIILSLKIAFWKEKDVVEKKMFQMLEKFDKEIYDNDWGEAKYTMEHIRQYLQESQGLHVDKLQEILNLLEDLSILSCYLNNGEFEIRFMDYAKFMGYGYHGEAKYDRRALTKRNQFSNLCEIEYGEKHDLDDIQRRKKREGILTEMKLVAKQKKELKTIYSRKMSPLLKLKHNKVDFLLNEKFYWNPDLKWKIKHLIDVSEKVPIDKQIFLMQDLWMILLNEEKSEYAWEMMEICPREWVFSILINLYNSELIEKPVEINDNYFLVIERWIEKYPWEIIDLINTIKLFNNPKINDLLSKELQKIDIEANKKILKIIWKRDKDTEESLTNWFKSIRKPLE